MKILVIAAHPDDEILGMGGTIKKYTGKGHNVKIIFMATGILSRRSSNYKNSIKYKPEKKVLDSMILQLKKLKNDAKKAAQTVGVKNIEFVDFPDNEMDIISNLEITKKIEGVVEKFKPSVVFTHYPHDINIDHKITYNATITATRPISNSIIKQVIAYEVPSSTEWNFPSSFSPNIFVDISKELKFKLKAMQFYKNEIRKYPHPRSIEALKAIAKRWGTVSGFQAAEAFVLIRDLRKEG